MIGLGQKPEGTFGFWLWTMVTCWSVPITVVVCKCRSITSSSDSSTFWLYKDISLWPLSSHKIYILFSIQNYIYYFIEMCCYRNCSKLEKANTVVFFWTRTKYHEWEKKNLGKSYYFGWRRQNIMHTEKLANSGEWTY